MHYSDGRYLALSSLALTASYSLLVHSFLTSIIIYNVFFMMIPNFPNVNSKTVDMGLGFFCVIVKFNRDD